MPMLKIFAHLAAIVCKTPGLLIRYYYHRRIGARTFRQELLKAGIAPGKADELTASYKSMFVPQWNRLF
ncbi:hypothetical protein [Gordoniibacillus kamchatkensis]|nr:hypothetical protein [Paenibacillus sp. VKM B-2647]